MTKATRIAIMTGGGDCPGINAVIRAVAKKAILKYEMEVIGFKDGYEGVINRDYQHLSFSDVSGILTMGGTILGTSNIANPYRYPLERGSKTEFGDVSQKVRANLAELAVDCLVCIGGDCRRRGDRQAAHHCPVPPPGDDYRGHGTQCGLDCTARGRCKRRRRHSYPGDTLRH